MFQRFKEVTDLLVHLFRLGRSLGEASVIENGQIASHNLPPVNLALFAQILTFFVFGKRDIGCENEVVDSFLGLGFLRGSQEKRFEKKFVVED